MCTLQLIYFVFAILFSFNFSDIFLQRNVYEYYIFINNLCKYISSYLTFRPIFVHELDNLYFILFVY